MQHKINGPNPACQVCGGVDDSLTTDCCGALLAHGEKLSAAMRDAIIAGLDYNDSEWVLRQHDADRTDMRAMGELSEALAKLAFAKRQLCNAETGLTLAEAAFNQCNADYREALETVRATLGPVVDRLVLRAPEDK